MQCTACHEVYLDGLELCPKCETPSLPFTSTQKAPNESIEAVEEVVIQQILMEEGGMPANTKSTTLIEFPGTSRAPKPQWRKELSEKVREIQERKAREAALEATLKAETTAAIAEENSEDESELTPQLELVSSNENASLNPVVIAALRRIERARQPLPPKPRPRITTSMPSMPSQGASTAVARVIEDPVQAAVAVVPELETLPEPDKAILEEPKQNILKVATVAPVVEVNEEEKVERAEEKEEQVQQRTRNLIVVPSRPAEKIEHDQIAEEKTGAPEVISETPKKIPRKVFDGVLDDSMISRMESQKEQIKTSIIVDTNNEKCAPFSTRFIANLIDLGVVGFIVSPFAAIIELVNGSWGDIRVVGSLLGIALIIMFLYFGVSVAFAGRTWGMSLVSLHVIETRTGLIPTTSQAFRRALVYMGSLITLGLGILFAFIDREGRTVHDHLSGTIVIRE